MNILEAHEVTKNYSVGTRHICVLDQVSLTIEAGQFVVIRGSSGSGKSTLLSILSGLDKPTSGKVYLGSHEITAMSESQLAPLRNERIGFVFQSFHLVPSLTALENIMFPAELRHDPEAREKAVQLMEHVGILDRAENFPHQLSGGEKQRVALCRALINNPQVLFADEPTGNLDSSNSQAILDLLLKLWQERMTTLVVVTHNGDIARLAPSIIHLKDGKVVLHDRPLTNASTEGMS